MASLRQPTMLPNGATSPRWFRPIRCAVRELAGGRSELNDVTADGSAVWTRVGSSTKTTTYTPAAGSRLVNNSTTNVATFGGGSYSVIRYPGSKADWNERFDNLKVAINGTEYTLNGSLDDDTGFSSDHLHRRDSNHQ